MDELGFATKAQVEKVIPLGEYRNACRVLASLEKYMHVKRIPGKMYYLNKEGRQYIGSDKSMAATMNYEHVLMRNDLYIHYGRPKGWKIEESVKIKEFSFRPDVIWKKNDAEMFFIEIDNKQTMARNKQKIHVYHSVKDKYFKGRMFPTLVWYTTTELRKEKLLAMCEGLKVEVYTKKDLL